MPRLPTFLHRLGRHPATALLMFALAWLVPLAVAAAGSASAWDAGVQIVTAQRLVDGRFEPVTLPDLQEGRGVLDLTYRMKVTRPPGSTQSAVYLPGVFAHERITFNGLMVSDRLGTASSGRPRGYERMRLVPVPDAFWLPGENLLDIRIAARELTVMPPVWVGSEASLRERYRAKLMAVAVGPAVVAIIVGCAALVMLLLWWRRPAETLYGYFGAGALLWALHTGWTLLPATVLSGVHHRVWSHAMQTLAVALLTIFVLRFTDSARPGAVRALWLAAAGGPVLMYAATVFGVLEPLLEAWRLAWVGVVALALVAVARQVTRQPQTDRVLVLVTVLTGVAFGLRDWLVSRDGSDSYPVVLLPYAGLLFMVMVAWILIDRFVRTTDTLEVLNRDLERRVQAKSRELSDALEAMRRAKDTAELANRAKTNFLASASHDLRQPIHAIGLYLGALRAEPLPERPRELTDRMTDSMVALDDMFNALLDISRMDAGAVVPRPRPFGLDTLLHRLATEFGTVADPRGLRLVLHVSPRSRELNALSDPMLVERIVRNLVANAVKYTREGGVLLGCRLREGPPPVWHIEVVDTGPGIPPAERERVFDEFYQVGNPERDRASGLGLGLSIVRRLTQLLGLTLSLHSVAGRGTRFVLQVPATTQTAVREPETTIGGSLAGVLVAVIEDDREVRHAMVALLQGWGCTVAAGADADEVLAAVASAAEVPQAVVADYRLRDGRNGVAEARRLQAVHGGGLPVLVVTGDSAPERVAELQASGLPWLPKPVPAARLRSWLGQATRPRPAAAPPEDGLEVAEAEEAEAITRRT